jgi:hypothetical protein
MSLFTEIKGKGNAPAAGTSEASAPPSIGTASGTATTLQNISATLEILRSVVDTSEVLAPLRAVCGALKVIVDTGLVSSTL